MKRLISHSEVSSLQDCSARHAFAYTGALTGGSALQAKDTPVLLREGRIWGAAVAALHAEGREVAFAILDNELEKDCQLQEEAGLFDHDVYEAVRNKLWTALEQYAEEAEIIQLDRLEHELLVALPSRSGKRSSNRYYFLAYFDGLHTDPSGRTFLFEAKWRKTLSSYEMVANSRQIRRYAWAWRQETGRDIAGVIVDERLNGVPKEPRILKNEKVSDAKDQVTTAALYEEACEERDQVINPDTVEALLSREWQKRHTVFLTDAEIEEAGKELVSLGQQVQLLDSGQLYPDRNVKPQLCNGCRFKDICNHPEDTDLVDALFNRVPAKRERPELEIAA